MSKAASNGLDGIWEAGQQSCLKGGGKRVSLTCVVEVECVGLRVRYRQSTSCCRRNEG